MSISYLNNKNRVRQSLGTIDLPSSDSSFDEAIQYLQEQKEYWESQIGQSIQNYEYYLTTDRQAQCSHSETHVFDAIFIADGVKDVNRDGDPHYVPMVFGERDMTPGEIAYYEAEVAKYEAEDRKRFEAMKKRFEPDSE